MTSRLSRRGVERRVAVTGRRINRGRQIQRDATRASKSRLAFPAVLCLQISLPGWRYSPRSALKWKNQLGGIKKTTDAFKHFFPLCRYFLCAPPDLVQRQMIRFWWLLSLSATLLVVWWLFSAAVGRRRKIDRRAFNRAEIAPKVAFFCLRSTAQIKERIRVFWTGGGCVLLTNPLELCFCELWWSNVRLRKIWKPAIISANFPPRIIQGKSNNCYTHFWNCLLQQKHSPNGTWRSRD